MLLTCPACSARYLIDSAKIGENGRTVRCAKCGNTWFVAGVKPEPLPHQSTANAAPASFAETLAATPTKPVKAVKPAKGNTLPARPQDIRKSFLPSWFGWVSLLVFWVIILSTGFFARTQLVQSYPRLAHLYHKLHISVTLPTSMFILEDVAIRTEHDEIIISGNIRNPSDKPVELHQIQLTALDEAGKIQDSWWIEAQKNLIEPHKTTEFITTRPAGTLPPVRIIITATR